ncbi:MAG: heme biosynthesis protein HemY [Proteobacteria bacterium]|nr:heme biosynthesis protein HemY [Pseudomonadota bacterium]MDA1023007.1 heme biosynthesis protein HemY [Pseudomonadota bacterium]
MIRALVFFLIVGAAIWGALSLVDDPGAASFEWAGYRIDTSFAFLLGVVALIAVLSALLYRFWLFLVRTPGKIQWAWRAKRRQRGYQALTRGMVAVAAGDAVEAERQAKRADGLLDEPPLTLLVSAQAAQMKGDEKAASGFFEAMMKSPETEFLGLRGLLTQAMKRGDKVEALGLARRAYRLQPKSTWVASHMFDLQIQNGQWLDARVTCKDLERRKLVDGAEAKRRKAVLSYQLGLEAKASSDADGALGHYRDAGKLAPTFIPAVRSLAEHWIATGKSSKAAKMIVETWALAPHPALLEPYWQASGATAALDRVKATEKLIKHNPEHLESLIAKARASLEAGLWGEARQCLENASAAISNGSLPGVVCRMMAELEESENQDHTKAHEWLMRASEAGADATWVCEHCGNAVAAWSVVCGKCEAFDSYAWHTPPSVIALPGAVPEILIEASLDSEQQTILPPRDTSRDAGLG